jgi:hypothetical protein
LFELPSQIYELFDHLGFDLYLAAKAGHLLLLLLFGFVLVRAIQYFRLLKPVQQFKIAVSHIAAE